MIAILTLLHTLLTFIWDCFWLAVLAVIWLALSWAPFIVVVAGSEQGAVIGAPGNHYSAGAG